MPVKTFALTSQSREPGSWMTVLSIAELCESLALASKAEEAPVVWTTIIRLAPGAKWEPTMGRSDPHTLVCIHGMICIDYRQSQDRSKEDQIGSLFLDDNMEESQNFRRVDFPTSTSYQISNLEEDETVVLLFTTTQPNEDPFAPEGTVHMTCFSSQWISDVAMEDQNVTHIYVSTLTEEGMIVGNRFHTETYELYFPLVGRMQISTVDTATRQRVRDTLSARPTSQDHQAFRINTEVAHSVKNLASGISRLIVFSSRAPCSGDDWHYTVLRTGTATSS